MLILTREAFNKRVGYEVSEGQADVQTDNQGQLVIYTGLFQHGDGTIQDCPDPESEDDVTDA